MFAAYLHGFASSARSTKAAFFRTRLAELGVVMHVPDFNEPDFETLTITRMVAQVARLLDTMDAPAVLIGSSLGGFVAVHAAARYPDQVKSLVLLAPALDFGTRQEATAVMEQDAGVGAASGSASSRTLDRLGDRSLDEWRRTDRLQVMHHAYGRLMAVRYALYEDALRFDAFAVKLTMPVLIFQGLRDTAVDAGVVQRWARGRPNVDLHLFDDDHQLLASLDAIWSTTSRLFKP